MSVDWLSVAAEVDEAIKSVSSTGAGYPATIRRETVTGGEAYNPTVTPSYTGVHVIQQDKVVRAMDGSYVTNNRRTLTLAATGFVPKDTDQIAVRVEEADADESSPWQQIIEVRPLSPADVDVLYELEISK